MTVEEYEAILLDLVLRKKITIDEGQELLRRFMAGDFAEDDLPLTIAEATKRDDDRWILLFALALPVGKRRIDAQMRKRKRDEIRRYFDEILSGFARQMGKNYKLRSWQSDAIVGVGGSMLASWLIGHGKRGVPTNDAQIDEQLAYLYRFAAEVHAAQALDRPFSQEYLVNRALMYGGAVWAAWFMGNESVSRGAGYVSRYIARDDRGTCSPCRSAVGYYLPNDGPIPGQVCLGGGNCRCERIVEYNPEMYRQLGGT